MIGSIMRIIMQRSREASVSIAGGVVGRIAHGLVILVGVAEGDTEEDAQWLAAKAAAMRIFSDEQGRMNRSVAETGGGALVISQFTLHASTKKGNRPGFTHAARPELAVPLYELFIAEMERHLGARVERGIFGADMRVTLVNDGPVTIQMDSRARE